MTDGAIHVGFIGLGHMGHGMAVNILKRGFPLHVMAHKNRRALDDVVYRGAQEVSLPKPWRPLAISSFFASLAQRKLRLWWRETTGLPLAPGPDSPLSTARPPILPHCCACPQNMRRVASCLSTRLLDVRRMRPGKARCRLWSEASWRHSSGSGLFSPPSPRPSNMRNGHRLKLVNNLISLGYAALYSEALALAVKAGLDAASFDNLVRSSRMHCPFYDTFIGWVVSGDRQSHPYALDDALRTISDVLQFSRSVGLKGRLAGSVREIYAKAVADGFGAAMLPELARDAVAKANDIDLKPAFDGAPQ
jgi:hypothetical protein